MRARINLARYQDTMRQLTVDDVVTPFGCCNYFDACTDELLTLSYRGALGLLDWLNFTPTEECYRSVEFITYVRPEQSGGVDSPGFMGNPCGTPWGFELGTRKLTVEDFGRIARSGPTRDLAKQHIHYCKTRPRYRLDGQLVTSEDEWDMLYAMDAILLDMNRLVITGNSGTAGQFDGLQRWVSTIHSAPLDSYVVNWNGNPMAGGAGVTINGAAIAATWDIIDVLLALFRNIKTRIKWNQMLAMQMAQNFTAGDMIILLPTSAADCLLDFYTCWRVCPGQQFEESNLNTPEARAFRDKLIAADNPLNVYGDGYITLDGTVIPLLTHDWGLINSPTQFDMYFLTGSIGNMRIFEGEMLDADEIARNAGDSRYTSFDGGRIAAVKTLDNMCKEIGLWHWPRLFCLAPWAQMRFQDVQCDRPGGPLSADPGDTSYYPETSFSVAECPPGSPGIGH